MNFYKKPLLLISIILIAVALISWYLIPAWRNTPGGLFVLLGTVILGVLTASKDAVELLNGIREMTKAQKQNKSEAKSSQTAEASGSRSVAMIGDVNGSIHTGDNKMEKGKKTKQAKKRR